MNTLSFIQDLEETTLSPYATKSQNTKGRQFPYTPCDIRTEFQRDRDRLIHCKAFRRLMHKTQVFLKPEGDHYRTRLTHTLEVAQIARTIARSLRLNEDLTEAIALGHDLGHTPFGHTGESAIHKITPKGFRHNEQSIRVVDVLEKLNLTEEVRDGILNHRGNGTPHTLEGKVVQLSDKIAYINHDIDDAIRAGVLKEADLPKDSVRLLGGSSSQRINFLIRNVINASIEKNEIFLEHEVRHEMMALRKYMFDHVYASQLQIQEKNKITHVIHGLYEYYNTFPEKMPEEFVRMISDKNPVSMVVTDYIACMTDRFCLKLFHELFVPTSFV